MCALPTLAETDEIGHRRAWQLALYEDFYAFLNNGMAANGRIYCSGGESRNGGRILNC